MSEYIHISRINTLPGEHFFRSLRASDDPRVSELERLRRSLARAAARMDEFDERLGGVKRSAKREVAIRENGFASHVAAGLSKAQLSVGEFLDRNTK
jgi:hypothetical protein